ncbi:uncharacterized protein LOC134184452 isoform X2 [Corticium candelabrum]|uniref:uncharacterized protein LOC134184452 isoform X2 n=1 Tax=Corticium candelabrum TaxID=121492 RepID=UPI002E321092|nr:uncharacterized protein LOC134184452 isoform X2 [Corticium candelabrum]
MSFVRKSRTQVDYTAKVVLVGDCSVGKTCLLFRFVSNEFMSASYISTVGVDMKIKDIDVNGTKIRLQIWDTAGQERFRSLTHSYFRGANGLILVYDLMNPETFHSVRHYMSSVKSEADEEVILMLLGNKSDVPNKEKRVSYKEGIRNSVFGGKCQNWVKRYGSFSCLSNGYKGQDA